MRHFLEDHLDDSYRGFPSIGIELDPLTSPEMRAMLHADKIKNGIRIADVKPGTPFSDLLKENDVLTAIDGKSINENGYFLHAVWGKVHLKYLLNRKYAGDAISLSLLRGGNPITIEGKLSRFDSNDSRILSYRPGNREPHIIFGGLVIRELTVPFLRQWGKNWRDVAPYGLLYQLYFRNDVVKDPDQHRFIIISRVLADDFNRGYSDIRNALVKSVNGVAVASLEDVRRALSAPLARGGEQFARIVLGEGDGEIVLSYSGLDEAHRRMANTYHVPFADSFFTR